MSLGFNHDKSICMAQHELDKVKSIKNGIYKQTSYTLSTIRGCFRDKPLKKAVAIVTTAFVISNCVPLTDKNVYAQDMAKNTVMSKIDKDYSDCFNDTEIPGIGVEMPSVMTDYLNNPVIIPNREKDTVVLAIIDSGVNTELQSMQDSRIIKTPNCEKFVAPHGTMFTSVALERLDKYPEYKDKVLVMPVLLPSPNPNDISKAVKFAVDSGANVISCSFGINYYDQKMKDTFDYAYGKNVVVIAAAGNNGHVFSENYPAAFPSVISVGAVNKNNQIAGFSNYNDSIDFVDLGQSIKAMSPDGSIREVEGTSFAAPKTAVDFSVRYSKGLKDGKVITVDNLKELFVKTSVDLESPGWDVKTGWGVINIEKALNNPLPEKSNDIEHPNVINFGVNKVEQGLFGYMKNPNPEVTHISFGIIDLNDIDTSGMKIILSGTLEDGSKIKDKALNYALFDGNVDIYIKSLPSGEYVLNISGIKDKSGNVLMNTKRFFSRDTINPSLFIKSSLHEHINGIDNEVMFEIITSDKSGLTQFSAIINDTNQLQNVNFDSRVEQNRAEFTVNIPSYVFDYGENKIMFSTVDRLGNNSEKIFRVVKEGDIIKTVTEITQDLKNIQLINPIGEEK